MSTARYLIGDVFEKMAELPDGSVDLIVTSPPFLALRSYLPEGHPDKAKEIGSEPTPAAFLDTLLALAAEWRRVLAPHGSICVELGDTYSGSGGGGGDYGDEGLRAGQPTFRQRTDGGRYVDGYSGGRKGNDVTGSNGAFDVRPVRQSSGWPLAKSLCGIPTLYPWSLAYGRNLLTGEPSPAGQWRIRNLLCWARPNPPVGALGDKFRPATSYVTVACVSDRRWFDLDAVREPGNSHNRTEGTGIGRSIHGKAEGWTASAGLINHPAGTPPLDWWDDREATWEPLIGLPTQPYKGSHYATFPTRLPAVLIDAMCPREVCVECHKPRERITDISYVDAPNRPLRSDEARTYGSIDGKRHNDHRATAHETVGWTDCGHGAFRRGVVLDPFGGSGTTGAAAVGLGRDAVLIDLDERNLDLARERIGLFLEAS